MNINDLAKNQLGQYGSVVLDATGEVLNLVGSEQYVITAIQCITDTTFNFLTASTNKCNTSLCTTFGGEHVLRINSAKDIDDTNNRVRVHGSHYKSLKVGDSFNYVAMGNTAINGITDADMDGTIADYFVIAKDYTVSDDSSEGGWLQVSATDGGSAVTDFSAATFATKHSHKFVFPAIVAPTVTLFEASVDANTEDNFGGTVLATGQSFAAGTTIYGRWNYVDAAGVIICYLGAK